MLAMTVRVMPHCWRARLDLPRGVTEMDPSSMVMVTSSVAVKLLASLGPLISMVCPESVAETPSGRATGCLPIRDMSGPPSKYRAEHFAADIGGARGCIRHHTLGGGDNRHTETLADLRDVLDAHVDAAAGGRDPGHLANDGRALVILEADLDAGMPVGPRHHLVAADVAFGLQHLEHALAQLGGRGDDGGLAAHLPVADPGEHIADRIVHISALLTSSTSRRRATARQ